MDTLGCSLRHARLHSPLEKICANLVSWGLLISPCVLVCLGVRLGLRRRCLLRVPCAWTAVI